MSPDHDNDVSSAGPHIAAEAVVGDAILQQPEHADSANEPMQGIGDSDPGR